MIKQTNPFVPTVPGFYACMRNYWSAPKIYELMKDGYWKRSDSDTVETRDPWANDVRFLGPLTFNCPPELDEEEE